MALRAASALAGAALLALPRLALACPSCAGRDGSEIQLALLGSMILFPFAVAGAVVYFIRRGESQPE